MSTMLPDVSSLSFDQKLELIDRLTESLRPDEMAISDELLAELERRHEEYVRDPSSATTWDELKQQLMGNNGRD